MTTVAGPRRGPHAPSRLGERLPLPKDLLRRFRPGGTVGGAQLQLAEVFGGMGM